jgi:hypothetical protein
VPAADRTIAGSAPPARDRPSAAYQPHAHAARIPGKVACFPKTLHPQRNRLSRQAGIGGSTGRSGSAGIGGAAGSSGSAGRGGSAGFAGVGGSAGIAGGSGGVTTGGAGAAGGNSREQTIDAICKNYEQAKCPFQSCYEPLRQGFASHEVWGCGDEWLDTNACTLRDQTSPCGGGESCIDAQTRFEKCLDDAEICVGDNAPGAGCVMSCERLRAPGWAVECKPDPGGLICVCTSGQNSGSRYVVPDACQSEEWMKTIRSLCR